MDQNTWASLNQMTRIYKLYDFAYHIDDGLPVVR
jgi:hypothetical protein